jgi:hypothetical protein
MSTPLKPGARVRMSQACKDKLRANASGAHVNEFGSCVGIVEGPTNWNSDEHGPEVDVRWEPSGLRYAYHPDELEIV